MPLFMKKFKKLLQNECFLIQQNKLMSFHEDLQGSK